MDINNKIKLKLPEWEEIPDFGIYREQLINILQGIFVEEHPDLNVEFQIRQEQLGISVTPSMINNYVKWGLVPKPENKKYHRDSVALFILISSFKTVLFLNEIKVILENQLKKRSIEDLYSIIKDINDFSSHNRLTDIETCPEVFDGRGDIDELVIFCGIFDSLYILLSVKMRVLKARDQNMKNLHKEEANR